MRRYGDRGSHVHSIDVPYSMHGEHNRTWTVIASSPVGDAKRGEVVRLAKHLVNGSILTDTGKILPAYIVEENVQVLPDNLN